MKKALTNQNSQRYNYIEAKERGMLRSADIKNAVRCTQGSSGVATSL
ncbi:hypothetical protein BRYFOR_06780 [Marvinbryantia formatexigens DSM 14469]|uniref:Uncharacterized protein n=1 Tax=Marvinbryantia formatexigens DSM 14469 TaxID=478749 RepID=C6LDT1_9FIRM|nr:hypothetical protein BRYFOR_06780 [Marvinbryantia formatexigens DSM 14469]